MTFAFSSTSVYQFRHSVMPFISERLTYLPTMRTAANARQVTFHSSVA